VKWIVLVVAMLIVVFLGTGVALSLKSREGSAPGLSDGSLTPCPDTPNCVCSECEQGAAFVLPLPCEGDPDASWMQVQLALLDLGGEIVLVENGYLAATFQSPLLRFVDDVELRQDRLTGVIHIRSASRVGRSDLGKNRERVEAIRSRFYEVAAQ
jgi:uncharacterized protein (DUF1499 family)